MKKIKILLADDHQMFREGLKALLEEEEHLTVPLQASNGKQVLNLLENNTVDIAMIDIHMPVMNGIECLKKIRIQHPGLPVLALTMSLEEVHVLNMLKAGANGYLLKNSGSQDLLKAIETVLNGQPFYSFQVGKIIMDGLTKKSEPNIAAESVEILTQREIQVLKLIAMEYSNREISDKLSISVRTVDAHRRNLLHKIGARNTAGLTRYAIKHFVLDQEKDIS